MECQVCCWLFLVLPCVANPVLKLDHPLGAERRASAAKICTSAVRKYLSRQNAINPEVKQWLDEAEIELRRISIIANQTLRFHKQSTKPQPTTCLSLFSATLNLYESRLKNAGITVERRKRANEPVACFEGDVRQVLSNLITNAIDAMPLGGRLIVRSREATEWSTGRKGLALTVADNGYGMSYETQCRMFEAFYTTKGIAGNGMGLWISADIMARHKGTISIRSSQGAASGTVVTLFLPFEVSPVDDIEGARPQLTVHHSTRCDAAPLQDASDLLQILASHLSAGR